MVIVNEVRDIIRPRISRKLWVWENCCLHCIRLILFWGQLTRLKCYAIVLMGSNYLGMLLWSW